MANFGENSSYLPPAPFSFQCKKIREIVQVEGPYSNIFSDKVNPKTVKTLVEITKFREEYIYHRRVL